MADKEPQPKPEHGELIIERRSLTDAAIVATPVAVALQPVIGALADKYIGKSEPSAPPPQETPKKD